MCSPSSTTRSAGPPVKPLTIRPTRCRALWPVDGGLPDALTPPGREAASILLGAAYATGLAWSAMIGRAVPERGFPSASAVSGKLIHERDDTVPSPLRMPGRPVSEITSEWLYHS